MEPFSAAFAGLTDQETVEVALITLALGATRLGALLYVFPLFTRTGIQAGVLRGALAIGLSLPVLPGIALEVAANGPPEIFMLLGLAAKEALIGIALGLVLGLPFWAAAAAGNVTDFQRGATMESMIDPNAGEETTPLGIFLFNLFAAVFLTAGLFERSLLFGLYESFQIWPPLTGWPGLDMADASRVMGILASMLETAMILAAPLVFAMLILEAGLALATRFVQQINVFYVGMALKTILAMLVFPLYLAVLMLYLEEASTGLLAPGETLKGFFR